MNPRLNNSLRLRPWFLCRRACGLALLSLAVGARGADNPAEPGTNNPPVIQLRAAIQVDGQGVLLSQVLQTNPPLPSLRLCDSPAFGKSLLLKRAEVIELARAAGLDKVLTNWAGPEFVRVTRRARPLAERDLIQQLTSILQKEYVKEEGKLELRLSGPWTTVQIPDEPLTLRILDVPTSGVSPCFIVRFEFETAGGEHIGSWQAPVLAKVWREIWVAGSVLKRGELVRGADLHRERRDMLLCHEPLAEVDADDASLEFCESVQVGSPIYARYLRPRAVVHRGQSVVATIHDGALVITLKVEALEDGAAGQIIRIRNPLSQRDLHGKVLDEENIMISL